MILNLIHRPATGRLRSMFDLQQQMAHSLGLKVTVLIPYDTMFEPDIRPRPAGRPFPLRR